MIEILPINDRELGIKFKYDPLLVEKVRGLPQRRWDRDAKIWVFMPSPANLDYISVWFSNATWHPDCTTFRENAAARQVKRDKIRQVKQEGNIDLSIFNDTPFQMPPKDHQKIALALGQDLEAFAYLMDQGTGKTKVILDDAAHNWRKGRINGLLVIAPNSVKTNWVDPDHVQGKKFAPGTEDEVTKHMAPDVDWVAGCWVSAPKRDQRKIFEIFSDYAILDKGMDKLAILIVNVETIAMDRCNKYIMQFLKKRNVMIAVDESTRIKHRTASRSRAAHKFAKQSPVRRIATGTPVIKSPLHAFSQFYFLDPEIIGFSNYKSFEARYGVRGGFEGREILFFQNLDELQKKIDSASYRVLKEDCLDLEPKIYQRRSVHMLKDQAQAYEQLKEESILEFEAMKGQGSSWIEANIMLTKYLRLQQITAGFLPILDEAGVSIGYKPFAERPPKIAEAMDIIEECQGKVIIWCRFIPELLMMKAALDKAKITNVPFYGAIGEADRVAARRAFQEDNDRIKVFLGQIQTGGIGITLNKAQTVIYLSNTFNTEERIQSEDRAHRIGTQHSVTYVDLITPNTVDVKVIQCLREDKKISDMIMKDGIREWI